MFHVEQNHCFVGGCLGVDLSTREGYSVKKTVLYTVFSCKSVASAKPGRMRGNAEAAVPPQITICGWRLREVFVRKPSGPARSEAYVRRLACRVPLALGGVGF